jgi:methylated-DNA-[protein]-cysteine S-methyltransferase
MSASEKRQIRCGDGAMVGLGINPMAATQTFFVERIETPTGRMRIVCDDTHHVRAVDWDDHEPRMRDLLRRYYGPDAVQLREVSRRSTAARALLAYFDGDLDAIEALATATAGTVFQRAVWSALRKIPPGRTVSYGLLAAEIGKPKAVRAVGLANGANPIAIVVPCHRVIGADASLTGYGGGLNRKRWLLAHERGERPLFEEHSRRARR